MPVTDRAPRKAHESISIGWLPQDWEMWVSDVGSPVLSLRHQPL
jgi:hypothetical protein